MPSWFLANFDGQQTSPYEQMRNARPEYRDIARIASP
jgi:hypothetical protein